MSEDYASHYAKDIAYHQVIGGEYHEVVVTPRRYTNDLLFAPFERLLPAGGAMLDLGCGTGHMILRFGRRFGSVVGIDHSPAMLEVAGRQINATGMAGVTLRCESLFDFLERCKERFDLVTCVGCLHHLRPDDVGKLLAEAAGVLAADGVLLIAEPIEVATPEPAAIRAWNRRSARLLPAYSQHAAEPDEAPLERARLAGALDAAGLSIAAENRTWEILPGHVPPLCYERLAVRYLHWRYGSRGCVLALVARHRSKTGETNGGRHQSGE